MANPTRGPWCVEGATSTRYLDIALDYEIPDAGSPVLIGSAYSDEGENPLEPGYISPDEAEANARLMAASWDLLGALKKAADELAQYVDLQQKMDYIEYAASSQEKLDAVNAVIAKAEGRS